MTDTINRLVCQCYTPGGEIQERVPDCRDTYREDQRRDVPTAEFDWQTEERTCTEAAAYESQTLFSVRKTLHCRQKCQLIITAHCTMQSAIACRPSVRPSVTFVDQDHICWQSWKLIAGTISPTPSLFVAQTPSTYFQGNMGKFGEE